MGSLITTLRRFVTNKNTVTILGVLAGVIVLWFFYNQRVTSAVTPTKVPIAKDDLIATQEITADDIDYVEVNSALLKKASLITNQNQLVGYFVNVGTSIPKGGLFYTSQVVEKKELPNSVFDEIPEGYTLFYLKVTSDSTFGNSIYPGDRIDLYLQTKEDGTGKLIYDCFIESIEVLAVRDSSNQNVFDSSSKRTPDKLLFAVPSVKEDGRVDMYTMLEAIKKLSGFELTPVPRNKAYTSEAAETKYANEYLRTLVENEISNVSLAN